MSVRGIGKVVDGGGLGEGGLIKVRLAREGLMEGGSVGAARVGPRVNRGSQRRRGIGLAGDGRGGPVVGPSSRLEGAWAIH